jgi:hypothetical protein
MLSVVPGNNRTRLVVRGDPRLGSRRGQRYELAPEAAVPLIRLHPLTLRRRAPVRSTVDVFRLLCNVSFELSEQAVTQLLVRRTVF